MQLLHDQQADQVHALKDALVATLEMASTDAREVAGLVIAAFGGREELDDEELSPDLRSMFYTLEGQRLLSFRREEYRNEDGHIRRAFYWHIRWEDVVRVSQDPGGSHQAEGDSVYDELPRGAWSRT